jgi:hypothetical protein
MNAKQYDQTRKEEANYWNNKFIDQNLAFVYSYLGWSWI